jgi:hypothetical protein
MCDSVFTICNSKGETEMKRNTVLLALGLLLFLGGSVLVAHRTLAQGDVGAQAAIGTAFTYQGQLTQSGNPVNDNCDFTFTLHDALTGGNQVGSVLKNDVQVQDGHFAVDLDFGSGVFTGGARYLQVALDCGSGAILLSPRTALHPVPYALFSVDADLVDGQHASAFAPASHTHSGSEYQNVVVVAKSGGDFTSIQGALDSITDASASNPYLVWVAPGTYAETVMMKPYVDIEGAGELATKIVGVSFFAVIGASNAELRFLTVENNTSGDEIMAIYNASDSFRLTHVTAMASGGSRNHGVRNGTASTTMTHVTASATGGDFSMGVSNDGASPEMVHVIARASNGTSNRAVENANGSSPKMMHVTAEAWGGDSNFGVFNSSSSSPKMMDVTAVAERGTSYGVYNDDSWPEIWNSTISASRGTNNYGIYNSTCSVACVVKVNNSQITGDTNTIVNMAAEFATFVGASQLNGGDVNVFDGTVTCYGCYDEYYTNYGGIGACP